MNDDTTPASCRIQAAKAVLDLAFRATELEDLEARLKALENAVQKQDGNAYAAV